MAQPGSSGADIVVATPGRLTAHLRGTPGFNLAALRFLVVDETDRLLRQAYQDWLPAVAAAIAAGGSASDGPATRSASHPAHEAFVRPGRCTPIR